MTYVTTYPPLPAHVVETFEGMLLARFAEFVPASGNRVTVFSDEDYDTNDITMDQQEYDLFLEKSRESTSDLANDLRPVLENYLSHRVRREDDTTIDELAEVAGRGIALEDVIHAICQRFPEEVPYVEVQWSSIGKRMIHGSFCGGASVVTPQGVQSMSSAGWLAQMRSELAPTVDPEEAYKF